VYSLRENGKYFSIHKHLLITYLVVIIDTDSLFSLLHPLCGRCTITCMVS
jgi:hypothetical protein